MATDKREPVLCYVAGNFAYFTTRDLKAQCGDNWRSPPYQDHAGPPYEWHVNDECERFEITKVAFDGELQAPCDLCGDGGWSVHQINAGSAAWLASPSWASGEVIAIPAGTTLERFIELIHKAGGRVYVPLGVIWRPSQREAGRCQP